MPLTQSAPGTPGFGRNIATEIAAGKPEKQAVAIAYGQAKGDAEQTRRVWWDRDKNSWIRTSDRPAPKGASVEAQVWNEEKGHWTNRAGMKVAGGGSGKADSAHRLDAAVLGASNLAARMDAMVEDCGARGDADPSPKDYKYHVRSSGMKLEGYEKTLEAARAMMRKFEKQNPGHEGSWAVHENRAYEANKAIK